MADQQARAAGEPPDGLRLVRDWQAPLARDPGQAWGGLWPKLCAALRWALPEPEEAADRTQALVLHWLERDAPAGWSPDVPLRVWIQGIVRLEAARILRRRRRHPIIVSLPRADSPVDNASATRLDSRLDLRSLVSRLPPPYREILGWRLARATRRNIADLLVLWTGIGREEARRGNACVVDATVFALEGTSPTLQVKVQLSNDLENREDSGGGEGEIAFTNIGYDEVTLTGIACAYVRLKYTFTAGTNSPKAVLAAGVNVARL